MAEVEEKLPEEIEFEKYNGKDGEPGMVSSVGSVNKGTIGSNLSGLENEMKKLKFNMFIEKLKAEGIDVTKITDENSIPEEKRNEFEEYKLPNDAIYSSKEYTDARDNIIGIIAQRNETLNKLIGDKENNTKGKLQELRENAENKIKELEGELSSPDIDEDKKSALENQIERLKVVIDGIGVEGSKEKGGSGLLEDCRISKEATQGTKKEAIKVLASIVEPFALSGKSVVINDQKIINTLGKYDPEKDYLENVENEMKNIESQDVPEESNKEEESKEEQEQSQEQAAQPKTPNAKVAGSAPMTNGVVAPQGEGIEEKVTPNYLAMLNYNEGNVLNSKSSINLLKNFASKDLTDDLRMEMLNDPNTRDTIIEAMKLADGDKNPINKLLFNRTRASLVKLAKGPMISKAIESLGKKYPDNLEESYKDAKKEYLEGRKKIEEKLGSKEISKEEREDLHNQLNELDSKYASLSNVEVFRDAASRLDRKRYSVYDRISGMFNTQPKLPLRDTSGESSKIVEANKEYINNMQKGQEEKEVSDFVKNIRENTNRDISTKDREINEDVAKETQTKKIDQPDEPEL